MPVISAIRSIRWWRDRSKSGGQLIEQIIHMVHLMHYLMDDAVTGIAGATEWLDVLSTVFAAVKYGNDMIDDQLHIVPSTTKAFVIVEFKDVIHSSAVSVPPLAPMRAQRLCA